MSSGLMVGLIIIVVAAWGVVLVVFRKPIARLWREPVLRHPVVIIESDDWGPGPRAHAQALERLCDMLARHRDETGRAAVMTIGTILGVPDNAAIAAAGCSRYSRRTLLDPEFGAMRASLTAGRDRGVLALQLHGLEHLWPSAFLHAATATEAVREWIMSGDGIDTESLPSHVQSRWADTSVLPSRFPPETAVFDAVAEEVDVFRKCFGAVPEVVVPPTFVWHEAVERAWAAHGARTLVTPGRRLTGRDALGKPAMPDRDFLNGEHSAGDMTCLVRDIYFEPALGHTADRALDDVIARYRLGRPALLETHRLNFTGDDVAAVRSIEACDRLLSRVREALPDVRFMSSAELAEAYRQVRADVIESRLTVRVRVWLERLTKIRRLRKTAWVTGLAMPASLLYVAMSVVVRGMESDKSGYAK